MQDPMFSTPAAEIRRAGVDLNGLMTVLGKHLYSTPVVALRELVQNAHDSIIRRRIEQPGVEVPSRIAVQVDAAAGVLRIIDTGAGLTRQEIHDYLATVGVGYTRGLRQGGEDDEGLIGMFGLGFLSAFVLARRVSVRTTSYQTPELGHLYVSSNAEQYTVSEVPARAVGTEVELELHPDFLPLANEARLHEVLGRYCALLSEPIFIGAAGEALNPEPPPWPCIRCRRVARRCSSRRVSNMISSRSSPCRCVPMAAVMPPACCGCRTVLPTAPVTTATCRCSCAACCWTTMRVTCCRRGRASSAG